MLYKSNGDCEITLNELASRLGLEREIINIKKIY